MPKKLTGSILYILITLLVISLYLDRHESLEKIELAIQDTMYKLRGKKDLPQDIVIVGIDDAALGTIGKWPWNRDKMARLLDAISAQSPKTIALDMEFGRDQYQKTAGFNDSLALSIARAGNVVLAFQYSQMNVGESGMLPAGYFNSSYRKFDDPSKFSKYPPMTAGHFFIPDTPLADSAARLGFANVNIDYDRKIREQALVVGYRGEFYPSLQVAAAAHYLDAQPGQLGLDIGTAVSLGSKKVPVNSRGFMKINFGGPERTFKYYSAAEIINKMTGPNELAGKLVLVGFCARGATNIYPTPVSLQLSGLELDANIIENIIHDNTLKGINGRINVSFFILIAIGLFSAFILPKVSLLNRLAILAITLVVLINVNYVLFSTFNQETRTFYPALEIFFFLAAAPLVKTGKELKEEEAEAEDEVDYESLLSSSQSIQAETYGAQLPHSSTGSKDVDFGQTVTQGIPASTGHIYSGAETAPLRTGSSGPLVTDVNAQSTDHFGRYKILRPIGKGAMGMVYQGLDPAIDRPVALKTIRLDQGDEMETSELRERLTREAKAAGKLSHPNIVTIYDVGQEASLQYIAMEFLEGLTLESILKKGIDWDYRTITRVMIQACEALDYAHENGIVHRDIKPANIMILEGNKIKVMDFGIARLDKSASMTQTGTALGTPNYISPEQLKGQPVDRRSDIFSLGVVFYEVLTREKPFKGETISALIYSILHTDPPRPSELNLDIPRIFDKIIAKALVKDPDLRFQRAKDMADILKKLI